MKNDTDLPGQFGRSAHEPLSGDGKKKKMIITVAGVEVTIRIQEYQDGRVFQLQLTNPNRDFGIGRQLAHDAFLISVGLQHGTPLSAYIQPYSLSKTVRNMAVDGYVGVTKAHSTMDAVMQVLAREYGIAYGPQLALPAPAKKPVWKPQIVGGLDLDKS